MPRETKIGTGVAHVTRDSDTKFKGQGHQAALLTAALTREAGAAVTVRTYWSCETTALCYYVASARRRTRRWDAHGGGEGRVILCPHTHSLLTILFDCWS